MNRKKSQKIVSINQDTGEILEGVLAYFGVKYNPYTKGWIMVSQEALEILASDSELSKDAYKVLIFLMSKLDFENWIYITQREIAKRIKIDKSNVSKAINLLLSKTILLKGPSIGKSYGLRLNPFFGWKGKGKNLDNYRKEEKDRIDILKNEINKKKEKKLKNLSKKFNMSFEELEEIQNELNLM